MEVELNCGGIGPEFNLDWIIISFALRLNRNPIGIALVLNRNWIAIGIASVFDLVCGIGLE